MTSSATLSAWGVATDYDRLTDVALCRPDHYRWLPTNAVAEATLAGGDVADPGAAMAAHGELEAALTEAGVAIHRLVPDPNLAYQVYARDSGQMTPYGLIVTRLQRPERQAEWAAVTDFAAASCLPIWRKATAGTVEGGDIHLVRPGVAVIGVSGGRTEAMGAAQVGRWLEAEGWRVRLEPFPEHFLHFDLLFAMAAPGVALACLDVLDAGFADWARGQGIALIPVTYRDAMALGANVLALGDGRVLSSLGARETNAKLRAHGLTVLDPDLTVFTRGGGGARCLTMPIARVGPIARI